MLVIWVDDAERAALMAERPDTFFTTAHYEGHPLVLVRFADVAGEELTELLTESWRLRAPRRLAASFDARPTPVPPVD